MDKFFIVENGMISEDYILAPNIECALKHAHLKHNMHDKVIDKIKIKRKEDLVDAKCVAYDETSLQNSLNHCPNIRLISDISINGPIYPVSSISNNVNIVSEPSTKKQTISLPGKGSIIYISSLSNQFEVIFNNIILNVDKNANGTDIFNIGDNHKLTFNNSEINITNTPNIIRGGSNSVVTIKDSSLNINNIPSDGKGIQSDIVNLEGNHLLEFNNNNTVFTDVSNLTISNNNQFNYLDNSVGILAKQINIISNKQMSFNENNPNFTLINATTGTIDISNSNLLFYKNIISGTSYGTLLWAPTDIIFDGGSLVALNNSTPFTSLYSLINANNNIIFKNHPWFNISTNLSNTIKMSTNDFSGKALIAYNTNLSPTTGSNLDVSADSSLCSVPTTNCPSTAYNIYCFNSTSEANICIDTETNLGQCYPKSSSVTCTLNYPSTIGCRCHMSPPLLLS